VMCSARIDGFARDSSFGESRLDRLHISCEVLLIRFNATDDNSQILPLFEEIRGFRKQSVVLFP